MGKKKADTLRVALVHDWLVTYRGGERVLESIAKLFPEAPIYTLFYDERAMPDFFQKRTIKFSKTLNFFKPLRKLLLPWLPAMIESLPLEHYDLIISTSSCVAKGVLPGPHAKHLCYIHSPMRYVWDQRSEYFRGVSALPVAKLAIDIASTSLRQWDVSSCQRVDQFIANSHFVASRVRRYYGRSAKVIHPPIDLERFVPLAADNNKNDFYLAAGAFVSYKRFDLAIKACEALGKKLIVAGSGPMESKLRALAGKYTSFEIQPDPQRWRELLQQAKALIFPGVEDFGMVPIEAMACGTPVIALKKGGALDYIIEGQTGAFFEEPSQESLSQVIGAFDPTNYNQESLHRFAKKFATQQFEAAIAKEIREMLESKDEQ